MNEFIQHMSVVLPSYKPDEKLIAVVEGLMKEGKIAFLRDYVARKQKEGLSHGEER